ncbi:nicotinate (nicotinamide) nucleotide adenylyltransferase [Ileibacterium valens]|uniref:Probable nicotinate-nucleotide adenylyltransferase n=1 Tax=Ileibacterium valens TaxID=1862668 RepID=A0A1U7NH86_9FIRM|nr:nicotinate (nicotinamide) nucleotide adenylyltransferase [Ileibacterium valens]OLU38561.1 nicotinate (nicotinamide) nucleotide adenylyltransferase [Erysipelotrichaceae bacterium NYU-BL-E8]OLU39881.1 nicotinate (nicotinamide) nucleotide adenylyltransferase [Erysipelotrichaceae bacterium NYU-BL-F16]OLU40943.1 nicotinate (nicotinamide) nucleotide adenylyltransferase [Ileibacterium valens]
MKKKKVALLGGSFDPIHWGHLNMAKAALEHLKVDEVWFIPSNQTPLKDRVLSPAADRLAMVRLALKEDPRFKISTVDLSRNGKSYTFDTLKILKKQFPEVEFAWLMGADQANQFDQWKNADQLLEMADFAVVDRDGKEPESSRFNFKRIPMVYTPVSSSEIRKGEKINFLPESVRQYLLDHELYLVAWVSRHVSAKRLAHSASVARLCRMFAKAHGLDEHKAWLAGLFHDVAKDMPINEQKKWVAAINPAGLSEHHAIWHGYAGSEIVRRNFGIEDPVIQNAIFNHVKGTSYDPYAMIVFAADKLDPLRGYDSKPLISACMLDLYNGFMLVKRENREFLDREKRVLAEKESF